MKKFTRRQAFCLGLVTVGNLAMAQTGPATTPPPSPAVTTMETFNISDVPVAQDILPTSRPYQSVFGLGESILDTPRSVDVISREEIDAVNFTDTRDLVQLTAGAYSPADFGDSVNPTLRGQVADVLVNGQRLGLSATDGSGVPRSYIGVESMDVFKGPASVVDGASQYVGGGINLITKAPYFDGFHGQVSMTAGTWNTYRWTADFGGPINSTLAYRVAYEGAQVSGYYQNYHDRSNSLYTALTWRPSSRYTLEFNNQVDIVKYTQVWGINRVTPQLIKDGLYITGVPVAQVYPGGSPIVPSTSAYPNNVTSQGNLITPTGEVELPRNRTLYAPGDGSRGQTDIAQVIQTLHVSDDLQIVNNTLFNYVNETTLNSDYLSLVLSGNYAIDSRTEIHDKSAFALGGLKVTNVINTGVDFRLEHVVGYIDYYHSPTDAYDLSLSPSLNTFPLANIPVGYNSSLRIPGTNLYGTPGASYPYTYTGGPYQLFNGNGSTTDSTTYQPAYYFQDEMHFSPQFALTMGARADLMVTRFIDPLPPPGYTPVASNITNLLPSANLSAIYKPVPWITTYLTYSYSQSADGQTGGGYGLTFATPGDITTYNSLSPSTFHVQSHLFEAGTKFSLLKDRMFLSVAVFNQTRDDPQISGPAIPYTVNGTEVGLSYQPNKAFFIVAGYALLAANADGTSVTPRTISYTAPFNDLDPSVIVGTGQGSPSNGASLPYGNYRVPLIPEHNFNLLANYRLESGFGLQGGIVAQSRQNLDWAGTVVIPNQYTANAALFYRTKRFEIRLDFLNLTNQKNWSGGNSQTGLDAAYAELPFHMEGTVKYKF